MQKIGMKEMEWVPCGLCSLHFSNFILIAIKVQVINIIVYITSWAILDLSDVCRRIKVEMPSQVE